MSAELAELDAPDDLREHVAECVLWSKQNEIATPDDCALTAEHLRTIKAAQKRADEFFDPPIAQAFALHKMLCQRKRVITDPLKESEAIDKNKMLAYQQAEQAKAEDERRRLQAIADEQARREREKIEQAAAKQRAIEAEARAKAEAARQAEEKARREAESASAAQRKKLLAAAEAARLESEAAERKAASAAAKAEVKEDAAIVVVAPVVAVVTSAPKIAGVSTRKTWTAEVIDQAAFIAWACEAKRFDLLLPNNEVLKALAKGLREAASMPGVKFSAVESMSAKS